METLDLNTLQTVRAEVEHRMLVSQVGSILDPSKIEKSISFGENKATTDLLTYLDSEIAKISSKKCEYAPYPGRVSEGDWW